MLNEKNGDTRCPSQPKIQNQNENENHDTERRDRCVLTYRNGCKNSAWMTEFLNTETHTPVLLVNHLWSLRLQAQARWTRVMRSQPLHRLRTVGNGELWTKHLETSRSEAEHKVLNGSLVSSSGPVPWLVLK